MKPVWVVQVAFTGRCKEMHEEAQAKFGQDSYNMPGFVDVVRTKGTLQKRLTEWASLGNVAYKQFLAPQSWEEALMELGGHNV